MTDTFNVGDVVRLKSGGPLMTITSLGKAFASHDIQAFCTWFKSENETVCQAFPFESIKKIER